MSSDFDRYLAAHELFRWVETNAVFNRGKLDIKPGIKDQPELEKPVLEEVVGRLFPRNSKRSRRRAVMNACFPREEVGYDARLQAASRALMLPYSSSFWARERTFPLSKTTIDVLLAKGMTIWIRPFIGAAALLDTYEVLLNESKIFDPERWDENIKLDPLHELQHLFWCGPNNTYKGPDRYLLHGSFDTMVEEALRKDPDLAAYFYANTDWTIERQSAREARVQL